jgi:uncharacterized protein (DUF1697 family)
MPVFVALFRGINVGKAKRLPMATVRSVLGDLGATNVSTLLNSGNAIFALPRGTTKSVATSLRAAIADAVGFDVPTIVLTGETFTKIVADNRIDSTKHDPAKLHVGFVADPSALAPLSAIEGTVGAPDRLHVGTHAAYLYFDRGTIDSPLSKAYAKAMGNTVTARNWATVEKIAAAVHALSRS